MPVDKNPSLIPSLLAMKCPACRKGHIFRQKGIFPLKECLTMAEKCEVCGQKMELETYRGGGINYVLTVILFFLNLVWYWPIFGLSVFDNSIYYFLAVSIGIVLLAQPYLMRLSWALYLYMLVEYKKDINSN